MTFTLWGPVLAERRQGSSGGSLRARSPDSVQLSWPREPGAQDQTGPQVPQDAQMAGARSIDCILCRQPLPWGHRGKNGGASHRCLKAWAWPVGGLARAPEPCRTEPPACSLGPPTYPLLWGWVSCRSPGRRPGSASTSISTSMVGGPPLTQWTICLMPPWRRERLPTPVFWPGEFHGLYSPWGHKESDTTEQLSHSFTFSLRVLHWQLVACGRDLEPTNSWAGPLTVAHWQLVAYGRGPLWHWPMAEQDH